MRKYNLVVLVAKGVSACFDMGIDVSTHSLDEVVHALDDNLGWLVATKTNMDKWDSRLSTFDTRAINRHVQYHDINGYKAWFAKHMPGFIKRAKERGFAKLGDVLDGRITPSDYVSKPHSVDTIVYRGVSYPLEATDKSFIIRPILKCNICGAKIPGTCVVNFKEDGSLRGTQIFVPDDSNAAPARKGSKHYLCSEHAVRYVTEELREKYNYPSFAIEEKVEEKDEEISSEQLLAELKKLFIEEYENMPLEEVTHMAATIQYISHRVIGRVRR